MLILNLLNFNLNLIVGKEKNPTTFYDLEIRFNLGLLYFVHPRINLVRHFNQT